MDLGLTERHALVLGGTAGIGAATAERLLAEGARVTTVGRRPGSGTNPAHHELTADLREPGAAAEIAGAAAERFGPVDVLVLNGGGPAPGEAADIGTGQLTELVDLLLRSQIELTRLLLPPMRARGWGRVLAVGSSGISQPIPGLAASNVGRAALAGYLKTLAAEVAADGVTVNLVLPGRIDTDRVSAVDSARAERAGRTTAEVRAESERTIPIGRYGRPEEMAAVLAFLAGEPASYVTGAQIRCDGGLIRGL